MLRSIFVLGLLSAFFLQSAEAQLFSHGVPASVTSPTPDGQQHGVPASVVSPTPRPFGVNPPLRSGIRIQGPLRRFGTPRAHRNRVFVQIPVFYPIYGDGLEPYPSAADPSVPLDPSQVAQPTETAENDRSIDRSEEALREAYLQGAHDALARGDNNRYGEHYMDSRERNRQQPAAEPRNTDRGKEAAAPPAEDKSPTTIFIFKDGHQLETRNYAIMSGTLFDFSGKTLRKIQLDDIDSAATVKANDDRGVTVKLN